MKDPKNMKKAELLDLIKEIQVSMESCLGNKENLESKLVDAKGKLIVCENVLKVLKKDRDEALKRVEKQKDLLQEVEQIKAERDNYCSLHQELDYKLLNQMAENKNTRDVLELARNERDASLKHLGKERILHDKEVETLHEIIRIMCFEMITAKE